MLDVNESALDDFLYRHVRHSADAWTDEEVEEVVKQAWKESRCGVIKEIGDVLLVCAESEREGK
jgi:hypothetical protein